MSIPLDNLYNFLQDFSGEDIIIYRWFPHGSKKLTDLKAIKHTNVDDLTKLPILVAHDQEPLNYNYFENQGYEKFIHPSWNKYDSCANFINSLSAVRCKVHVWNVYEKLLLCHSEKNSPELQKFESDFVGVYYWSHALIARDWFRYAKHDQSLKNNPSDYTHDFLIYNRAWSGTREYRLKFIEMLVGKDLAGNSLTKFSPVDSGTHYTMHKFENPEFEISNFDLENAVPENTFTPCASADYVSADYNSSGIEIVLETIVDDSRIHLTEKILRPIACGKPFMLVSTPGALQYLRDYGFKTFDGLLNESYDTIQNPLERINAVVAEMDRIKNLPQEEKTKLFNKLNEIACYNKALFFSDSWQQTIVDEFVTNLRAGLDEIKQHRNAYNWGQVKHFVDQDPELLAFLTTMMSEASIGMLNSVYEQVKQNSSQ